MLHRYNVRTYDRIIHGSKLIRWPFLALIRATPSFAFALLVDEQARVSDAVVRARDERAQLVASVLSSPAFATLSPPPPHFPVGQGSTFAPSGSRSTRRTPFIPVTPSPLAFLSPVPLDPLQPPRVISSVRAENSPRVTAYFVLRMSRSFTCRELFRLRDVERARE